MLLNCRPSPRKGISVHLVLNLLGSIAGEDGRCGVACTHLPSLPLHNPRQRPSRTGASLGLCIDTQASLLGVLLRTLLSRTETTAKPHQPEDQQAGGYCMPQQFQRMQADVRSLKAVTCSFQKIQMGKNHTDTGVRNQTKCACKALTPANVEERAVYTAAEARVVQSWSYRGPHLKGWEKPRFYKSWLEVAYSGRHIPAHSATSTLANSSS